MGDIKSSDNEKARRRETFFPYLPSTFHSTPMLITCHNSLPSPTYSYFEMKACRELKELACSKQIYIRPIKFLNFCIHIK